MADFCLQNFLLGHFEGNGKLQFLEKRCTVSANPAFIYLEVNYKKSVEFVFYLVLFKFFMPHNNELYPI